VEGTARRKAGPVEHDAYKVVCEDNSGNTKITNTYYVSPELQTIVFRERYCLRYGVGARPPDRTTWEFVSQEPEARSPLGEASSR
jgi:hypothetical protein